MSYCIYTCKLKTCSTANVPRHFIALNPLPVDLEDMKNPIKCMGEEGRVFSRYLENLARSKIFQPALLP